MKTKAIAVDLKKVLTAVVAAFMLFGVVTMSAPAKAEANTNAEMQAQIEQLRELINQLKAQLKDRRSGNVESTKAERKELRQTIKSCKSKLKLQKTIRRYNKKNKSDEVKQLQEFLAEDGSLYPEKLVTGFFGPATERAVKRYQKRHGIVSSGSWWSTGYGSVGPKTRAHMMRAQKCQLPPVSDDDTDKEEDDSKDEDEHKNITCSVKVSPSVIAPSESVTVTWESEGADYASGSGGKTETSGSLVDTNVTETKEYDFKFHRGTKSVVCSATVKVEEEEDEEEEDVEVSVDVELIETEETVVVDDINAANDAGRYILEFDVLAFDGDVYVPQTAIRGDSDDFGVAYKILDADGNNVGTGSSTESLSPESNADTSGNYIKIPEGETETLELIVEFNPTAAGFYKVQLLRLSFNDSASNPDDSKSLTSKGYKTDYLFINDDTSSDDELKVMASSDDPLASTIAVSADSVTDFVKVFAFDLDTDDSVNNVSISEIPIKLTTEGDIVEDVLHDIELVVKGTEYRGGVELNVDTETATFEFDTTGLEITAGAEETAELHLAFKAQNGNYDDGQTIKASVSSDGIDAGDVPESNIIGSATGETHVLRTAGPVIEFAGSSETFVENDDTTSLDDEGEYEIEFDVTAFGSALYVNKTATRGTTMGTAGVNYVLEDATGSVDTAGSAIASLSSTANTSGSRYVVEEGETESFTLTVSFDPEAGGFYKLQLHALNAATTNADPTSQYEATPASNFETDPLSIGGSVAGISTTSMQAALGNALTSAEAILKAMLTMVR